MMIFLKLVESKAKQNVPKNMSMKCLDFAKKKREIKAGVNIGLTLVCIASVSKSALLNITYINITKYFDLLTEVAYQLRV